MLMLRGGSLRESDAEQWGSARREGLVQDYCVERVLRCDVMGGVVFEHVIIADLKTAANPQVRLTSKRKQSA